MVDVSPVLAKYAFYSSILALKMFLVVVLTARQRFRKKVFANKEDLPDREAKLKLDDPDVERVRRCHLNDLENIPVFWVLGALYTLTQPDYFTAVLLFRIFTASRIIHTIVYAIYPLPQPSRALAFFAGLGVNIYMAITVFMAFL